MSPTGAADRFARLGEVLTGPGLRYLLLWLALAVLVAVVVRLVRRWVDREIGDVNRRHKVRKGVGYGGVALVLVVGVGMLVGHFTSVAAVLGILAAGAPGL